MKFDYQILLALIGVPWYIAALVVNDNLISTGLGGIGLGFFILAAILPKQDREKEVRPRGLDWDEDQVGSHTSSKFYEQLQFTVRIKC